MNAASQTVELQRSDVRLHMAPGYFARRHLWDWAFALLMAVAAATAYALYGSFIACDNDLAWRVKVNCLYYLTLRSFCTDCAYRIIIQP